MANPISASIEYIRSSTAELKKVSWPSKDTTIRYSVTVIAVCIALALFFGALDMGFSKLVTLLLSRTASTSAPAAAPTPVAPITQPSAETQTQPAATDNGGSIQINPSDNGPIQKK
jgi:preprotein translocase SecE subunit